jgi:hypothetical protein
MTLNLHKSEIYANPYTTNWGYLQNMTSLQVKALKGMRWNEEYKEINASLWYVPRAWYNKKTTKNSAEGFMERLNEKILRL